MLGPSKMVALNMIDRSCQIADTLQVPIDTKMLYVRWAKYHGNMYRPGLVVCLKVLNEMPVFHKIHHVVLHADRLLLFTFALKTVCLDAHFHAFKVVCTADGPNVLDVKQLWCYKAFDMQMSYCNDNLSLFIVPYCFL